MYEAVRLPGDRSTTPTRFVVAASRLGYDGIVLQWPAGAHQGLEAVEDHDIDVVRGISIEAAERGDAARAIAQARSWAEIVTGIPADREIQRFIAQRPALDVLVPTDDIEHTTAKVARDHGIAIAFDLEEVLRQTGPARVGRLRALRRLATIVEHFEVPYVVTANANSHLALRAPRELRSLGSLVDTTPEFIERGLTRWRALAERTRRNRDDRFIEPGVRIPDDEADAG